MDIQINWLALQNTDLKFLVNKFIAWIKSKLWNLNNLEEKKTSRISLRKNTKKILRLNLNLLKVYCYISDIQWTSLLLITNTLNWVSPTFGRLHRIRWQRHHRIWWWRRRSRNLRDQRGCGHGWRLIRRHCAGIALASYAIGKLDTNTIKIKLL